MNILNIFTSQKNMKLLYLSFIVTLFVFIVPTIPMMIIFNQPNIYFRFVWVIIYYLALSFILLKIYSNPSPKSRLIQHLKAIAVLILFTLLFMLIVQFGLSMPTPYSEYEVSLRISTWGICMLIGYTSVIASQKNEKEKEIEQLKLESLQSRYEALMNQMNPHFFFNSLSSVASLIRQNKKDDSLEFIDEMSNVFRYILQINKETLITLEDELHFARSYIYMLKIRYKDNISFEIDISPNKLDYKLPPLSLLPLIENIVKHNIIDDDYPMQVNIVLDEKDQLVITNPIQRKIKPEESGKIGLSNIVKRYRLLVNREIEIHMSEDRFSVRLPLTDI